MTKEEVIEKTIKLLGCDTARISSPCGKHYMIIGWNGRTKDGEWEKDGKPYNFDYVEEKVIASGKTYDLLWEDIEKYNRTKGKNQWRRYSQQY